MITFLIIRFPCFPFLFYDRTLNSTLTYINTFGTTFYAVSVIDCVLCCVLLCDYMDNCLMMMDTTSSHISLLPLLDIERI